MSVIVMGMEMPHKCLECQFNTDEIVCTAATLEQSKEAYYKAKKNGTSHEEEMFKTCPLRPLPKKHGRLIDAEELEDIFYQDNKRQSAGYVQDAETIVESEGDW